MFIKLNKSRNGRIILTLTKGYWEDGKVKHKNIETFGYLDELEKQFVDPINHFKKIAKQRTSEDSADRVIKEIKNDKLSISNNRKNIGYLILKRIYDELAIKDFLDTRQSKLDIQYNLNKIFSLLIFSRILYPASKKHTYDNKDRFFEPFDFSLKDLYKSLDHFNEYKEDIQTLIWKNTKDIYNRDTTNSYYDCTNYYFEIEYNDDDLVDEYGNILEKGYRKRGPEKNHRPDPIIELGLLMDSNGIPLSYDLFPGNESEKTSLRPILKRTKAKFGINKTIVVADRGLNTSDNIFFLSGKNDDNHKNYDGYVYGQSVRGADKEFKAWVLRPDYITDIISENDEDIKFIHKSRNFGKEVTITRDNKRSNKVIIYQKQMVYYSDKYARKQKRDRDIMIEKAKDLIKNPSRYNKATSYGVCTYINNIKFNKDTGEIPTGLDLSINEDKIKEESIFDGYYSIVSSEMDLSDIKLRDIYRGLTKIEDTFKISKDTLVSRPVYVWTNEHIEAHFLTCFVSLVILRLLEIKTNHKYSINKMIDSIRNYSCSYLDENYFLFDFRNDFLIDIEEIFNIDLSNKILSRKNIKNLINY